MQYTSIYMNKEENGEPMPLEYTRRMGKAVLPFLVINPIHPPSYHPCPLYCPCLLYCICPLYRTAPDTQPQALGFDANAPVPETVQHTCWHQIEVRGDDVMLVSGKGCRCDVGIRSR